MKNHIEWAALGPKWLILFEISYTMSHLAMNRRNVFEKSYKMRRVLVEQRG